MEQKPDTLEMRLRRVSREICDALKYALNDALAKSAPKHGSPSVTGARLRPAMLTSRLGTNKSLASRVIKALEEPDEIRALVRLPTTQGLQLIQNAAEEVGAAAVVDRASRSELRACRRQR